jgi:uncharacterized membrane protein
MTGATGTTSGVLRLRAAWASFALCVVGLLLSAYLTYEHFTGSTTLACSDSGAVNCLKVTTSSFSVFLGVPVAAAGLAYFVVMTLLCLPLRFNEQTGTLRLIGAVVGIVSVLYLVYVEFFEVDAICLWCTGVHVVTLLLLGTVLWWRESARA